MIINEATYVDQAEKVIQKLANATDKNGRPQKRITTSKIRNLLAMAADIYNEVLVMDEKLPMAVCSRIDYLRVRFIYESGRDDTVKRFVGEAKLVEALKEINGSKEQYKLFNHYLEALVAYHRYYGGKDKD